MKVLVTGSKGLVGSQVVCELQGAGHTVREYDAQIGRDILHVESLDDAMSEVDAVIHAADLLGNSGEPAERVIAVNVLGTWNVLTAAAAADVSRVIHLSTVDVLGVFKGEREPDYLPLDAAHPQYPPRHTRYRNALPKRHATSPPRRTV